MAFKERHPLLAERDCEDCKKWVYGSDGAVITDVDGNPEPRRTELDCSACPKCGVEPMSDANRRAFASFLTCRALGCLPTAGALDQQDPELVRRFEVLAFYYHQKEVIRDVVMMEAGNG